MAIKKLTILHSNDIHGALFPKVSEDGLVTGGLAQVSGYIRQERKKNKNTLYLFAGDMYNGTVADKDSRGEETTKIMEYIHPDAMILGNHEMDYTFEKLFKLVNMCELPMVTTNIYNRYARKPLFHEFMGLKVDGLNILILGVTTEDVTYRKKKDELLRDIVEYQDPLEKVTKTLKKFKDVQIDVTILLSHLGDAEDEKLASLLPKGSVDLIIGGHTHTAMKKAKVVNGVAIVQLDKGSSTLGRFDLRIDTEKKEIVKTSWKPIDVNEETCPVDTQLQCYLWNLNDELEEKYSPVITKLDDQVVTNGFRYKESRIGNLFADVLKDKLDLDIATVGSGSLRQNSIGKKVTLGDLREMYFFDEQYYEIVLTGKQLKTAMKTFLKNAPLNKDGHGEYYQLSKGCHFVYDMKEKKLLVAEVNGKEVKDDDSFRVGIEGIHLDHIEKFWGLCLADLLENGQKRKLSGDIYEGLKGYMKEHPKLHVPGKEKRTLRKNKGEA